MTGQQKGYLLIQVTA